VSGNQPAALVAIKRNPPPCRLDPSYTKGCMKCARAVPVYSVRAEGCGWHCVWGNDCLCGTLLF